MQKGFSRVPSILFLVLVSPLHLIGMNQDIFKGQVKTDEQTPLIENTTPTENLKIAIELLNERSTIRREKLTNKETQYKQYGQKLVHKLRKYINDNWNSQEALTDKHDCTLLHYLVFLKETILVKKFFEIIRLKASGLNTEVSEQCQKYVSKKDGLEGQTPLHIAAKRLMSKASIKTFKTLIQHGAELESKDLEGNTALHIAAQNKNTKAVKILLSLGADAGAVNIHNQTPDTHAAAMCEECKPMSRKYCKWHQTIINLLKNLKIE